jgi:serine/threonine protein kinase
VIPVNRKIGSFEIVRKLARGGMADVYLGREEETERTIALKLIEHGSDADTLDSIEAERRGSTLQARLAAVDSRVVQIYGTGDVDDHFYVAMEYIEGQDLAEIIRRGPMPVAQAVEIGIAICETLEHAHSLQTTIDGKAYSGIVHGDIKPRNIRIDQQGRVRLLDFGIAKALSLSRRLTRNEFGSVQYASPERLDTGEVDRMSDLWSVGVVVYEMITGQQPYQAATTERLERMIRSRIPPPPAPEPCPEPLRRILIKSMAAEPERRYQSAADFAADLIGFHSGGKALAEEENGLENTRRTFAPDSAPDDSTRRTTSGAASSVDDSTRRTVTPAQSAAAVPLPMPVARANRKFSKIVLRTLGSLFLVVVIYAGYETASTYLLWKHGQQLEDQIKAETLTNPDRIWQQWTELSKGRPASPFLYGARRAVKQKLVSVSDHVITTYRNNDAQPVFQKEWEQARSYLADALMLDPGDNSVRSKLRLCEGQIARIVGTSRRNGVMLNQSAEKFNEAQQLMPKSPDPQLGLARLYVYGFKDIDKAYAALQEAERLGYPLGNREKSQLADGYRERADRLWYDSRKIQGLPQEKDEVQKAQDDYNRALRLYQEIAPYGSANASIARLQGVLSAVEYRLRRLQGGFWRWP